DRAVADPPDQLPGQGAGPQATRLPEGCPGGGRKSGGSQPWSTCAPGRVQRRSDRAAGHDRDCSTRRARAGSGQLPWAQAANEDGTFKRPEELRGLYASKGITGGKPVIAYCRIGERSSHTWFVLKELIGYPNVRNYDGSWTEYGSVVGQGAPRHHRVSLPSGKHAQQTL